MARFRAYDSESEDDTQQSDSSKPHQPAHGPPPILSKPSPRRASYASSTASSSSLSPESIEDDAEDSEGDSIMDEDELRPSPDRRHEVDENDEPRPWPQQLDLEPHRVHVMQTSLFRVPELAKDTHKEPTPFLKHRRPTDTHVETKTGPRTSFAAPRLNPPARKYARVAPAASMALGHENIYLDAGLGLGYSFRAGWGPKHTLGIVSGLGVSSSTYVFRLSATLLSNKSNLVQGPRTLVSHLSLFVHLHYRHQLPPTSYSSCCLIPPSNLLLPKITEPPLQFQVET